MTINFDELIDRRNTRSYKWDQSEKLFGSADILPLWVADMDFPSPSAVQEVLKKRADISAYGYAVRGDSYFESIVNWYSRRHNWKIEQHWITDSPSVVTSLSLAVELFTEPGGQVVLQSPVYYPFYDVIESNDRVLAKNPLVIRNGRYEMDLDHLESLFKDGAKLLLLCSPHNPGGRVWDREELLQLGELCLRYGVIVVSDEIHCDLVFPGHVHTPFATLSPEIADITITTLAATKTFNLPGLQTSFMITSNNKMRAKLEKRLRTLSIHMAHHFAQDAVEAAFNEGEQWLEELLTYVHGNLTYTLDFFQEHLPQIEPLKPDGTYLLWFDCRALGLDKRGLQELMFKKAKVAFSEGSVFGSEGEGWLRINLACPRFILEKALTQFADAVKRR
ncbi:pyridoxal phosphate-dependent aminotransferase [Paenibacillus sp. GSMTC-2017]|uniref:MalY/PatB family protein n=1 Tax=Paenibacillus sp. GSMTC-2017 TaxID=2794350 RepID=UPI0018D6D1C0|nr:MalY/PatB family protein [Paenibacillus sp. GSMTC-2017]MBH5320219.1 pyridoxal phosphate-dependent aminotransferase [Paenibacillus sp. GSMTC-2017]